MAKEKELTAAQLQKMIEKAEKEKLRLEAELRVKQNKSKVDALGKALIENDEIAAALEPCIDKDMEIVAKHIAKHIADIMEEAKDDLEAAIEKRKHLSEVRAQAAMSKKADTSADVNNDSAEVPSAESEESADEE